MCNLRAASAGDPGISLELLCSDSSQGGKQQKAMYCYSLFQSRMRYLVFFVKAPRPVFGSLGFISDVLTSFVGYGILMLPTGIMFHFQINV